MLGKSHLKFPVKVSLGTPEEYSCGISLDFSKAFDTVNHKILLKKLEHYGITGFSIEGGTR